VRVPDTGTGTRAGYHATDAHGFPCTSLSLGAGLTEELTLTLTGTTVD